MAIKTYQEYFRELEVEAMSPGTFNFSKAILKKLEESENVANAKESHYAQYVERVTIKNKENGL